jgi:hypothetical protein
MKDTKLIIFSGPDWKSALKMVDSTGRVLAKQNVKQSTPRRGKPSKDQILVDTPKLSNYFLFL